jgi:hypothetical protein
MGYSTLYVGEEFDGVDTVSVVILSDAVRFLLWNKEYVSSLSKLYENNSSLADKFLRIIILHEDGHGYQNYPDSQAELAAVSKWPDPLEAVTIGLALRLHYGESKGYFEAKKLKKENIKRKLLEKYCLWLREDLKDEIIDRALELIK